MGEKGYVNGGRGREGGGGFWAGSLLLFATVGVVWLIGQQDPFALLYLAGVGVTTTFVYLMRRGLVDQTKNFVELGEQEITVSVFRFFNSVRANVSYSLVQDAVEVHRTRFPHGFLGWPYQPRLGHVDVRLRQARWLPQTWGLAF